MDNIKLVVGLGNPGAEYECTRHNIGFMLVEKIAALRGLSWKSHGRAARIAKDHTSGLLLLQPQTFMNNSGEAVAIHLRENNLTPRQLLVMCDDFAIPLGALRLRAGGSAGGHNGLSSIISHIGTQEFARLRLGIGPLPAGADAAQFVLARIAKTEQIAVDEMLCCASNTVETLLEQGFEKAASKLGAGAK
jgi:PTH1 family peptidyl-tRNA hydrolase